jgi:Mlc titration factor MtfA (ptsG expression regulator)
MLFRWLTERRRRAIEAHPFPDAWEEHLCTNVAFWSQLADDERAHMRRLVQVFLAEKHWEGCGGLELTDEIRVTIAADACLLLLGRDHSLYDDVRSVLVYPTTVVRPRRSRAFFATTPELEEPPPALLGEAHHGGPVILVWDAVRRGARDPDDGRNVVFHEFAHKIDMLDGDADGTPPLRGSAARRRWAEVCSEVFLALRRSVERGRPTFLDAYGATDEAEFFAVATEAFFERAEAMRDALPELYALLANFYNQDPAARARRPDAPDDDAATT